MTTLPRPLVQQLLAQAQAKPADEICGLIAGIGSSANRCLQIKNVAEDTSQAFEMDPEALINAQKNIREASEELFAIYHSHPTAPAVPSARDLAESGYPDTLYLIISLNTKGVLELRGWRLDGEQTVEEPLRI